MTHRSVFRPADESELISQQLRNHIYQKNMLIRVLNLILLRSLKAFLVFHQSILNLLQDGSKLFLQAMLKGLLGKFRGLMEFLWKPSDCSLFWSTRLLQLVPILWAYLKSSLCLSQRFSTIRLMLLEAIIAIKMFWILSINVCEGTLLVYF